MTQINLSNNSLHVKKKQNFFIKFLSEFKSYKKYSALTLMIAPTIIYFIIFKYIPMYGITMAFKDYKLSLGILGSPWCGLDNFRTVFATYSFMRSLRNTVIISLLKLVWGFPMPIILALMLNEVRHLRFKKTIQTISYLPHFLSWVVLSGLFTQLLSPTNGFVNYIIEWLGGESIYFLGDNDWFRSTVVITSIWKDIGWSSILYLASIAGISSSLYEAAVCDGANRFHRMWHITLPSILPTIMVLLILNVGRIMNAGFDQIFNLYNEGVYEVADIIDTYVYRFGLGKMKYSMGTAVGLFKNLIGFALVIATNYLSKRFTESGIW